MTMAARHEMLRRGTPSMCLTYDEVEKDCVSSAGDEQHKLWLFRAAVSRKQQYT